MGDPQETEPGAAERDVAPRGAIGDKPVGRPVEENAARSGRRHGEAWYSPGIVDDGAEAEGADAPQTGDPQGVAPDPQGGADQPRDGGAA
ncbi:hypothetical protein [Streptomyces sp. NPDC059009]|uniref:hypothetical protein n=1 Tax=Streptomyces sp. NPDC059009 TaxID=3346694 RepID=UPI0036C51CDE